VETLTVNAKEQKKREIFFYTFSTDEGALKEFSVNFVPFVIKQSQLVNRKVFRELLPMLSNNGVIAYPHFNKFFMIFDLDPTKVNIFEHTSKILTDFIKSERIDELIDYKTITPQNIEHLYLYPDPDTNPSHFMIVRQLIYSLLKRRILETMRSQPHSKKSEKEERRRPYIPLSRRKTKTGLRMFLDCENIGETGQGDVLICRGIKLFLEVTPKYTGLIWVDLAVEVYLSSPTEFKNLSPSEMKALSNELGFDLYKKFLSKSAVQPDVRITETEGYLAELEFTNTIPIRYYVYSHQLRRFTEVSIVFQRVKAT